MKYWSGAENTRLLELLGAEWWGAGIVISGLRCRFAYGPADVTATHCLLLQ